MRYLALALGFLAIGAQAQSQFSNSGTPLLAEENRSNEAIGALQGAAVLLGATAAGISVAALVLATTDSAGLLLAGYPIATASGAYLTGRLVGADGSYLGALLGGAVGALPGAVLLVTADNQNNFDDDLEALLTALAVFFAGSPVGAAIGFHVVPLLFSGANGDLVPGATYRLQF